MAKRKSVASIGSRVAGGATAVSLRRSRLYSEELGVDLGRKNNGEYFKWFLASLLFGGRISETIAMHTYCAFERHKLLTPRRIIKAGWDFLVNPIMREGGYVRYDGRKSTQILRDCETLLNDYHGRLSEIHQRAANPVDLQRRLLEFYGIGPTTVNIFLRELRPFWKKADPEPLPRVLELAEKLGLDLKRYQRKSMTFARIEAGLIRLRKQVH